MRLLAFCVRITMATISITIIPSRANSDGSHTIRVVLSHKHKTCYISTPFKVNSVAEWRNGKVIGNPDANIINRKLRNILNIYQDRIDELPTSRLSCTQIRDIITQKSVETITIKNILDQRQKQCDEEERKSTATITKYLSMWLFKFIPEDSPFEIITSHLLQQFETFLYKGGINESTANFFLSILRTCVNQAIDSGIVKYDVHPFKNFKLPPCRTRDICLSKEEFARLVEYSPRAKNQSFAKDVFLLSFYLGGINFVDLKDADLSGDTLTFIRKKTIHSKQGERRISISIQPEAKEIIERYGNYLWTQLKSYTGSKCLTNLLRPIGEALGFEKPLMYYSARKTFVQFGYELDIPLYILEYAIGHSIKEASNRPIFNYIVIMREKADNAIRKIIDYSKE